VDASHIYTLTPTGSTAPVYAQPIISLCRLEVPMASQVLPFCETLLGRLDGSPAGPTARLQGHLLVPVCCLLLYTQGKPSPSPALRRSRAAPSTCPPRGPRGRPVAGSTRSP